MLLKYIRKIKENKEIALITGMILSNFMMIGITLTLMSFKTHYINKSPYTNQAPFKEDFCYQAFQSILDKKAHLHMMSKKIKNTLTLSKYKAMDLNSSEKISYVFTTTKGCKVITKDSIGLRQFDLILEENENHPFYYLLTQIHEEDIQEEV